MATKKTTTKKKTTAKKKTTKKPKGPATSIGSHPFGPGDKVGIFNAHEIEVEHRQGIKPFPKPLKTVKVTADGTLEVRGLPAGAYAATAPVGDDDRYGYIFFNVAG